MSQLHTIKHKIGNFWKRELKLRFTMWKDNVRARQTNLIVLQKFSAKMKCLETMRAFTKWQKFVKDQDFTVRLQGLAVMTSLT